jgi:hypothetical protein
MPSPTGMWRRSSVASTARVPAAAGVPAAAAARMSLGKHGTGRQDGSKKTDSKTRTFTHDCLLRGLARRPAQNPIIPVPNDTTRLIRLRAPEGVKVC